MWTCPLCNIVITPGEQALHRLRYTHLRARHPDVPLNDPKLQMRYRVNVITASESIPVGERSWNCPFCPAGLPAMEIVRLGRNQLNCIMKRLARNLTL